MRTSSQINEEESNDNDDDDFDQSHMLKTLSSTDKVEFSVHSSTGPSSELNDEDDVSKNILLVSAMTWFPIHTLIIMSAYN